MPPSLRLIVVALVLVASAAAPGASGAQPAPEDPPIGFTDGVPVGSGDEASTTPTSAPAPAAAAGTAAVTTRYFGAAPYAAVQDAVATTPRCGTLGPLQLTYSVLAPVFKESSAATTPSSAPAPMTLSRFDEWNGVFATTSNRSANFGLYAFRNPDTPYKRAFWHPGIGIWQYDSAGVGAPFTAIERMDARTVAADAADDMQSRWCNASGGPVARRQQAWRPWWYDTNGDGSTDGCPLCEEFYQDLVATDGPSLVQGIDVLGGVVARTCELSTGTGVPCWYVEPASAQGATGWRFSPVDGGSNTATPTPLSAPFYVVKVGGHEQRFWLRADTGYSIYIRADRLIGANARPRDGQPGSGLEWTATGLCDVTTLRGTCDLLPPAGVTLTRRNHPDDRQPLAGDFDGDGDEDLFFYGPGPRSDQLAWNNSPVSFVRTSYAISGTYAPLVADLDGNGRDELLWYDPAAGTVSRWQWNGSAFAISHHQPGASKDPLVGDFDGDGADEIHWYGAGAAADPFWDYLGGQITAINRNVSGTYSPIVADFDGNDRDDVLWYGPGSAPDSRWLYRASGRAIVPTSVSGFYEPVVGDFDGNGSGDILWYGAGTAYDGLWWGRPGGVPLTANTTVNGTYVPVVVDVQDDGRDDVIWYGPGSAPDRWFRWNSSREQSVSSGLTMTGAYVPLVGEFGHPGRPGVLWYGASDGHWWK